MILGNLRSSLARELERFFDTAAPGVEPPSDSAFCQARMKLLPETFSDLNHLVVQHYYSQAPIRRLKGLRILGVDGSTARLRGVDGHCIQAFAAKEGWDPQSGTLLARVSLCYDILNHVVLDAGIVPCSVGEQALAAGHLQPSQGGDLVLLDRNYASYRLLRDLENRGIKFCARIKVRQFTRLLGDFLQSSEMQRMIQWEPNWAQRAECAELEIPIGTLRLRLVKVVLNTGEVEVLLTNLLDAQQWSVEELAQLYAMRWGVEEQYKFTKSRSELERWSGKSDRAVEQDFHGRILLENLSSMLCAPAGEVVRQQTANSKYEHQVNRTRALTITRELLYKVLCAPTKLVGMFRKLTERYAKKPCPIRPGRKYPRNFRPHSDFSFPYKAFA